MELLFQDPSLTTLVFHSLGLMLLERLLFQVMQDELLQFVRIVLRSTRVGHHRTSGRFLELLSLRLLICDVVQHLDVVCWTTTARAKRLLLV